MKEALPALQEATLDDGALDALVADLVAHAEVLDVLCKGAPSAYAALAPSDLPAAVAALRDGRVRALQVRYRHAGAEWRDTLLRGPSGLRLVRIQTPTDGGAP